MRRRQNIAAVGGFLIVLSFVAERFLRVRMLWTNLSWADLCFLADFALFILINAVILLAIIVIFWGGYLSFRSKPQKSKPAVPPYSVAGRFRHVVEVALLSVVIALAASGLSKMRTPGWWVAGTLNKPGPDLNLGLFIGSVVAVDSAICFAMLWGGYLLWRKPAQTSAHRDN